MHDAFDTALTAALERKPDVVVPHTFTERVMNTLPPRKVLPMRVRNRRWGQLMLSVGVFTLLLLLAAIPVLPAARSNSMLIVEAVFSFEICALLYWRTRERWKNN